MNNPITPVNEQILPTALAAKFGSWGSKAHHYSIFSATWYRYRALSFLVPMCFFTVFLVMVAVLNSEKRAGLHLASTIFSLWLGSICLLLLGRYLVIQVVKQVWTRRKEYLAIIFALFIGMGVSYGVMNLADLFEDKHERANSTLPISSESKESKNAAKTAINIDHQDDKEPVSDGFSVSEKSKKTKTPLESIIGAIALLIVFIWWGGWLDFLAYIRQGKLIKDARIAEQLECYQAERNEAQMRLSVLASQVEPHFLFNTLSGVRAAMLSDPARGVVIIDHLVDYLRSTIPQMRRDGQMHLISVEHQFNSVRSYLGVIRTRIPRLSFSIQCEAELQHCAIAPLMLISLVENAVKHGIEPKKGAVHIAVTATKIATQQGEKLVLSVSDNGMGFVNSGSGSGIGLSNIRERLKQLYGDLATLELTMKDEGGVEARIVMPIISLES